MDAREAAAQLRLVLSESQDLCRIVVTQVDPDAIGTAIAMQTLLKKVFGRPSVILYCGDFGHPQNSILFTKYNLARFLTRITDDPDSEKGLMILVDSCSSTDMRLPKGKVYRPRIVIDHHRSDGTVKDRDGLVWVEDVGAAATLLIELCQELDPSVLQDQLVALLLALAIHTDTKAMTFTGERDRRAYGVVCQHFSQDELTRITNYPVSERCILQIARAVNEWHCEKGILVSGIGTVHPSESDTVSTVADWFIRREDVILVIIWAIVGGAIRISARSKAGTIDLSAFLRKRFHDGGAKVGSDGHGEGGARIEMGVPDILLGGKSRAALEETVRQGIMEKVFTEEAAQ